MKCQTSRNMKLSVIIVNYNVKYYLEQCINSLAAALDGIDSEVFVVDNHSKDNSVEYLSKKFPHINIMAGNHNLGFARANNIAISQSCGEYVLLLNPDTFVCEDTIRHAVYFMDTHPAAGGLGVKMLNPDGTVALESRRGIPSPLTSFYKMCGLCARYPRSKTFGHYYMGYLPWDTPAKIEVISGAFCMLRREALNKIGLLDEDYFMYGEDIDLSYRLLKGGYENWYLPSPILHYKGESTHKGSFRYVHVFYQAMLIFFRKHYRHLGFCITVPVKTAIYFRAAIALVQMQSQKLRKSLGMMNRTNVRMLFVCVGSQKMLDRCRRILRHQGLEAEFMLSDGKNTEGLAGMLAAIDGEKQANVVFDTEMFSYTAILDIMSGVRRPGVWLATFNRFTGIIITPKEIIR